MVQTTTHSTMRLGDQLVAQNILTPAQVEQILEAQKESQYPFGLLAEQLFDVDPALIEQLWIDQYLSYNTEVDLTTQPIDVEVLKVLNRRQAWQFRLLPLHRKHGELVAATTKENLPRAARFAWHRLGEPIYFLIAQRKQLEAFLMEHYPWAAALEPLKACQQTKTF